jgi:hypothetical protein
MDPTAPAPGSNDAPNAASRALRDLENHTPMMHR